MARNVPYMRPNPPLAFISAAGEASGLTAGSGVCCILDQACVVESAKAFEIERNNLCDKSGRQHGFHI